MNNQNPSAIRLRAGEPYKDSPGNILFTAVTGEGQTVPLETSGPPPGFVGVSLPPPQRLQAGKNVSATFFVWVPEDAESVVMTLNSDYWPPADILRDVTYTGSMTDIGGRSVKSNETRFTVSRAALE
jgi:hypothetical protein